MERKEFCELVESKREESGVSSKSVRKDLGFMHYNSYIAGKFNFKIEILTKLLDFIGYKMVIVEGEDKIDVNGYEVLYQLILKHKEDFSSVSEYARFLEVSNPNLFNIINKVNGTKIDFLLNFCEKFNFDIELIKK